MTNFDHFGYGLLTVFQLATAEGWTSVLYLGQDTTSDFAVIYYVSLLWIGSLVVISLTFAALESVWEGDIEDTEEEDEGPGYLAKFFQKVKWAPES